MIGNTSGTTTWWMGYHETNTIYCGKGMRFFAFAGGGVRVTGDRPLSRVLFWAINTVCSPEACVSMNIAPGKEFTWRIAYDFYTLAPAP